MKQFIVALAFIVSLSSQSVRADDAAEIAKLQARIDAFQGFDDQPHDRYVMACIKEALQATREGNYGVGACIVSPQGEIVFRGHNHVYNPYHRGDLHAEMTVILASEEQARGDGKQLHGHTLYTSVEPCVMCFARTIGSGVKACYYASDDPPSGMVHLKDNLPPSYKPRLEGRPFERCACSPELKKIAEDIYALSFKRLGKKDMK